MVVRRQVISVLILPPRGSKNAVKIDEQERIILQLFVR